MGNSVIVRGGGGRRLVAAHDQRAHMLAALLLQLLVDEMNGIEEVKPTLLRTQPPKMQHVCLVAAQIPLMRKGPRRRHSRWRRRLKC